MLVDFTLLIWIEIIDCFSILQSLSYQLSTSVPAERLFTFWRIKCFSVSQSIYEIKKMFLTFTCFVSNVLCSSVVFEFNYALAAKFWNFIIEIQLPSRAAIPLSSKFSRRFWWPRCQMFMKLQRFCFAGWKMSFTNSGFWRCGGLSFNFGGMGRQ